MRGKCIVTGNDCDGIPVEDTHVIRAIRAIKQKFGWAKNNVLVVSLEGMEEYKKRRKRFERRWATSAVISIAIVSILIVLPLILGAPLNIASFLFAPLLAAFIMLLALLDYVPPLSKSAREIQVETVGEITGEGQGSGLAGIPQMSQLSHAVSVPRKKRTKKPRAKRKAGTRAKVKKGKKPKKARKRKKR